MAQTNMIVAWLMLLFKAGLVLMAFSIVVLCIFWAIRPRRSSIKKDTDRGQQKP